MTYRGIVAVSLSGAVALGGAAAAAPKPPTCAAADAERGAGALDEARKAYVALLATDATRACATSGLGALAQDYLRRARALLDTGQTAAAATAFTAAYELDPGARTEMVRALGPQRSLDLAGQLDDNGLDGQARTLVTDTLETFPGTKVPVDRQHLLRGPRAAWWESWLEDWGPGLRSAGEAAVALALATVLALFLYSRFHKRLRIGAFLGPAADDAEAKTTRAGEELRALVRARIDTLARAQYGDRVDLAPSSGAPVAIPATVTDAVPQAKLALALLELLEHLLPPKEATLTLLLHDAAAGRVGVTATMEARWAAGRGTRTFWVDELPPVVVRDAVPGSYDPLVTVVAAWALHRFRPHRFVALGTSDPVSYAAFAAGADAQAAG